ncbi:hypothetical protein Z951_11380 [Streptomyces sp. PRh5]|nr:hypothetical protein Z951_11380 [Streptomyces sp. PRh5]
MLETPTISQRLHEHQPASACLVLAGCPHFWFPFACIAGFQAQQAVFRQPCDPYSDQPVTRYAHSRRIGHQL